MSPIEHLTEQSFPDAAARPGLAVIDFWASVVVRPVPSNDPAV